MPRPGEAGMSVCYVVAMRLQISLEDELIDNLDSGGWATAAERLHRSDHPTGARGPAAMGRDQSRAWLT